MVTKMLREDRQRFGWTQVQAAGRIGVSVPTYKQFEAGEQAPDFTAYERICELFGWPQSFPRRGQRGGEGGSA